LRTHGKSLEIARFLGADEKENLANRLETVLRQTRCNPADIPI
jgi:uncharacterized membrane protein